MVGKKSKPLNRKRHPVQTVQKKEGLKSGKVPKQKNRFELGKEECSAPKEVWKVERNQMTQLFSGRQSARPSRKEKSLLGKERGFMIWIRLHI